MAKHIDTGKKGESLAVGYFLKNGYRILHRNWRSGYWEVDLIAEKNKVLHFIEVKTKTNNKYGYPEDEVDVKKIKYLTSAAEIYLQQNPQWKRICFDILSITLEPTIDYFLIEDVFL